jgi:CDGSH-type Zn-finger protein
MAPKIFPLPVEVEIGCVYTWCGCGKSKTPPFYDGFHAKKDMIYE